MITLKKWLVDNLDQLIEIGTERISANSSHKAHVAELVDIFFYAMLEACETNELTSLQSIMTEWADSLSFPLVDDSDDHVGGLIAVLVGLKQVTLEKIRIMNEADDAIELILQVDEMFSELKTLISSLETRAVMRELRKQLNAARSDIESLDRSKTNFISVAAHELRTPITVMEGYLSIARSQVDNPDILALLDGVDIGVQRLLEIIADMIDVSRIELNMLELHFQPVLLHQIIDAIERDALEVLEERDISLQISRDTIPHEPTIADPTRLRQAMKNVVMNAIKFTPDGGEIRIMARQLPGFTDVIVEDTGIGIDPAQISHLFDAFAASGDSSLHSSGKSKFKGGGPGLGLCIAKGVLEIHGGTIWPESPGYDEDTCPGSAFHIMIPMRNHSPVSGEEGGIESMSNEG